MLTTLIIYFKHGVSGTMMFECYRDVTVLDSNELELYSIELGHKLIAWGLF